jgi:hypothetical protein
VMKGSTKHRKQLHNQINLPKVVYQNGVDSLFA